ncbi:flagellar biosynthesis anti-sigma factor FlgM [Sporosarcina sp. HYO08]|uniref:flagellar biosynthesis anti-sigma factor FlgM n=1 Tax=Sporosarcina sp. HYO08 TaxID=1759557 RepID=UPI0007995D39|nr:flagellar biosynthesis anti-sigma factor FlgM [Sporosarcina sp. HYO08]KXH84135.1 hypothetical protein AU377_05170 [Sporosarcina sp. HYO08]
MKIQRVNIPAVNPYQTQQVKQQQANSQAKAQTDQLEISKEAKQLSEQQSTTEARKERVQSIKAQIEAGTYKVDTKQLASNLVKKLNGHR